MLAATNAYASKHLVKAGAASFGWVSMRSNYCFETGKAASDCMKVSSAAEARVPLEAMERLDYPYGVSKQQPVYIQFERYELVPWIAAILVSLSETNGRSGNDATPVA